MNKKVKKHKGHQAKAREPAKKTSVLRQVTESEDFLEARKTARLDIPIKVRYRVIGREDIRGAVTKDIGAGGCLLLATEKLADNAELELDIALGESDKEELKLSGRIVRINREEQGLFEYGISFGDISAEARRLFADFCFAKMYEMIGLSEWPTDKLAKKE
ncbi:MAG: PilZ domain-containing protein [Candidatus Omnitrophica bacterium]|nr:PilZ domain-containing protein [Candidatus Omnitrophota bacterium]